jgi:cell division protease FtsH
MKQNWNENMENGKQGDKQQKSPFGCSPTLIWIFLLIALLPWGLSMLFGNGVQGTQIPYTQFRDHVQAGEVEQVIMTGERIEGELSQPATLITEEGQSTPYSRFVTYLPAFGDDELFSLLREQNVVIETRPEAEFSGWLILLNLLPIIVLVGIGFLIFRSMRSQGQGVFSMGKSRARLFDRQNTVTTFDDVAGAEGAKTELQEVVEFLKNPADFQRLGGMIPKGVLLVGPPGTGKTLLARAVAGEAGVPFFSITGSDFMEMFVGVGASRVRDMFEEAKKSAPSIIFIDELDSVGRRRGTGIGGGHDEREQTLNQLLSEMDGFEKNTNVIVMAATNRPDILDPALLRPGRFDRRITVDMPTKIDRHEILKIHARDKAMGEDVDLERLARGTPGFSGADLANLLNEAALLAARKRKDYIEQEDIEEARDKVMLGLKRENLMLTEDEIKLLAYHEAGHALVAATLPNADPIHKVTIVPRGRAMGVTQQLPERDRYLYERDYMLDRLAVMMGGRAAEVLVMNTLTSGAENDLKQATQLARKMVLDWGMSDRMGHLALGEGSDEVFLGEEMATRRSYSEKTAREVDEEIKLILNESFERAKAVLKEFRKELDLLVEKLIEFEEVEGEVVLKTIGKGELIDERELAPQSG